MKKKSQYDNSFSGALFPTADKGILSGPFEFDKGEDLVAVCVLGEPGKAHPVRIHERKKDKSPGKLIAEGTLIGTPSNGAVNASGNPTPAARVTLTTKKHGEIRLCVWRQPNAKQGGSYFQLKPDSFEPREVPSAL